MKARPVRCLVVCGVLLTAGILVSIIIDRHRGVPLFLAVIACGVLLGVRALHVPVILGVAVWAEQGIVHGFFNTDASSGDNLGAEGLVIGVAVRALAARVRTGSRPSG
jgi:hypothetical protein